MLPQPEAHALARASPPALAASLNSPPSESKKKGRRLLQGPQPLTDYTHVLLPASVGAAKGTHPPSPPTTPDRRLTHQSWMTMHLPLFSSIRCDHTHTPLRTTHAHTLTNHNTKHNPYHVSRCHAGYSQYASVTPSFG